MLILWPSGKVGIIYKGSKNNLTSLRSRYHLVEKEHDSGEGNYNLIEG